MHMETRNRNEVMMKISYLNPNFLCTPNHNLNVRLIFAHIILKCLFAVCVFIANSQYIAFFSGV